MISNSAEKLLNKLLLFISARKSKLRSLSIIAFLGLLTIPYQNCSSGFSTVGEGSGSTGANESASNNSSSGVTTNEQLNLDRAACAANFNAPSSTLTAPLVGGIPTLSFNSGLADSSGDSLRTSLPRMSVIGSMNLKNVSLNTNLNCRRFTTLRVRCQTVVNDPLHPISVTNAINLLGDLDLPDASKAPKKDANPTQAELDSYFRSYINRVSMANNCDTQNFDLNQPVYQRNDLFVGLNRSNESDYLRCVQGSYWMRVFVEQRVENGTSGITTLPTSAPTSAHYVKINVNNTCWNEHRLKANSDFDKDAQAGRIVAVDGVWAVAVVQGDSMGSSLNVGSVHVFQKQNTSWIFHSKLQIPENISGDEVSYVSIKGNTIAFSSINKSIGTIPKVGSVYIFKNTNGTWSRTQTIVPNDPIAEQNFGSAIALTNNYMFIGSPKYSFDDSNGFLAGKVYIYSNSSSGFVYVNSLQRGGNNGAYMGFGGSLAADDSTLLVGAPNHVQPGINPQSGEVFQYQISTGGVISLSRTINSPDNQEGNFFGKAISLGFGKILIGSPGYSKNYGTATEKNGVGAVYYYSNLSSTTPLRLDGGFENADPMDGTGILMTETGKSVGLSATGLYFGSPGLRSNTESGGAVCYMTYGKLSTNRCDYRIFSTKQRDRSSFGNALAVSGQNILIGAVTKADPLAVSGAIFVFEEK